MINRKQLMLLIINCLIELHNNYNSQFQFNNLFGIQSIMTKRLKLPFKMLFLGQDKVSVKIESLVLFSQYNPYLCLFLFQINSLNFGNGTLF